MTRRPAIYTIMAIAGAAAAGLCGCASHVKGSWACALDPGSVCASIADIDRSGARQKTPKPAADPVIEGAIPARLWGQGGWTAGPLSGPPVREPDPVLKVSIAPWVDAEGDYHAGAEVYAVMRHGGWYIGPPDPGRRVDLARLSKDQVPSPEPKAPGNPDTAAAKPGAALDHPPAGSK